VLANPPTDVTFGAEVTAAGPTTVGTEQGRAVVRTDVIVAAGDHRNTSSIQGAMVSGRRAARAVLARLGVGLGATRAG
jgi:hypothetical protein